MVETEEAIRQKYQAEIEQLRALTEKGMSAMESSHKRMINELEEKHCQELARLHVSYLKSSLRFDLFDLFVCLFVQVIEIEAA